MLPVHVGGLQAVTKWLVYSRLYQCNDSVPMSITALWSNSCAERFKQWRLVPGITSMNGERNPWMPPRPPPHGACRQQVRRGPVAAMKRSRSCEVVALRACNAEASAPPSWPLARARCDCSDPQP